MLKNFSSAAQYVVKCFRIAVDNITGARAAYNSPFEKKYKWPGDLEDDARIFFKLRIDALKSMQELNKFSRNFEKMRKQLFQIKMHFVQHDLLDLLDFRNGKIIVTQLEQKAIQYEKLAAQKRVQAAQAETAAKVLKQVSHPAVPAGPSNTQAVHPKSSHIASLPPYATNTTKEIDASTAYDHSSGSQIPETVQLTVSPTSQIAVVSHPLEVVATNPMSLKLMAKPCRNQMPSAMSLTTCHQVRQHDVAVHIMAPQSHNTGSSTTPGQPDHDQLLPATSCAAGPETHHATLASPTITDMFIDPILLSQGQPHGIQQFSSTTGTNGTEIRHPSPSVTFATPPRNVIAPSRLPHQPHFPESSPNMVIMQTPHNGHGLSAFPPTTPPMKAAGSPGTPSQLGVSNSSPPTQILRRHPDSELGFLRAATKSHELTVSQGHSCDSDNLLVLANADSYSEHPQVTTLDPIRDPPSTAVIAIDLPQSQTVQSNHDAGGAVADVPRQVYDQTPVNTSKDNVQEHTTGCEDIDYILGLEELHDL
jgi:hypothetical protein